MKNRAYIQEKDRKTSFQFLICRRILSANALLIFLPVFFSCARPSATGEYGMHAIDIVLTDTKGNTDISGELDIFAFNDDGLKRLDSYQRFSGVSADAVSAASRRGSKILVAVANTGRAKEDWAFINSFDAILMTEADIRLEDPSCPSMGGIAYADMGEDSECRMELMPLLSEIHIRSIRCDFSDRPYKGERLEDVKVYLTNVNARACLFASSGFKPEDIVNQGRLSDTDMKSMRCPEMLFRTLDTEIGSSPEEVDVRLYCYPNDCDEESPGSPFTRLVIEGRAGGYTYYYPININRPSGSGPDIGSGVGRHCRYQYDIVLTRHGTDDPDIVADPSMAEITCGLMPWYEVEDDQISF